MGDEQTVAAETPIRIAPRLDARPIGEALPGVVLRAVDRQGDFVCVEIVDGDIAPPVGAAFWLPADALVVIGSP
jgi:hypothetical protein